MNYRNNQHVQVPNDMTSSSLLTPECLLIYACIKKYMNKETLEAFPSLVLLCKESGASEPTVRKCIKHLVLCGYISLRKEGRKNIYKFNEYKKFEPFSYEFLENSECSFSEKAMILANQQYMFKDSETMEGKLNYSDRQLSEMINMSHATISRCNRSLQEKGLLRIVQTDVIDPLTGCKIQEKIYDLDKLHQGIVFALCNHEERIQSTEKELLRLKEEIASLKKDYELVIKENLSLKKSELSLDDIVL